MKYSFKAEIHRFPGKGGWWYVRIPENVRDKILHQIHKLSGWKFLKIHAHVQSVDWDTSILPLGKGEYFVALKKSVRDKLELLIGQEIEVFFDIKNM